MKLPVRIPLLDHLRGATRADLVADLVAGAVVAVMLVPQGIAYAMLAGLPLEVGLYASIAAPAIYGLLGTSRSLSVAPAAMVSLLVATAIAPFAQLGTGEAAALALTLALLVGAMQLLMSFLRLGALASLLSHPVLSGFASAAAIVIGFSQAKHLFGTTLPATEHPWQMVVEVVRSLPQAHLGTVLLSAGCIGILLLWGRPLERLLGALGVAKTAAQIVSRVGALVVAGGAAALVWALSLGESVAVVGEVPAALPPLAAPPMSTEVVGSLLASAVAITLVGFLESLSVARSLASRRREAVDANQELFALGAANVGASFTGGFPVAGGFGRSLVNEDAGARSGLASIVTAILVALAAAFLTPFFYTLPRAALASIIVVAVLKLVDVQAFRRLWGYDRIEAALLLGTFAAVFLLGIEGGILAGVCGAVAHLVWRTSRPHMAVVGRVGTSEHFRNVDRQEVTTCPEVLALRIDESLSFINAGAVQDRVLSLAARHPTVQHLVLIASGINAIDSSGVEALEHVRDDLADAGVVLHFAELKGPVMDRLEASSLLGSLAPGRVFLSTHEAFSELAPECQPISEPELVPLAEH